MNTIALRTLMIYAIVLPLAVFIGWIAVDAAAWDRTSFAMLASIIFVMLIPVLLKWHYGALIFSWHAGLTIFFLPGQPSLWMLMVAITLSIALINRIMLKRGAFIPAPSIAIPLLVLAGIILVTMSIRGGGLAAFGSSTYGGKGYVFTLAAIAGFFAVSSQSIPKERAKFYGCLFFLPGAVAVGSTLIFMGGSAFYPLFLIFPVGYAATQAHSGYLGLERFAGFSTAALFVAFALLAAYGIAGQFKKWWRPILLVICIAAVTLGGYRSALVIVLLVIALLFVIEGLIKSPWFLAGLAGVGILLTALSPYVLHLPLAVQRTLSILPIEVNSFARADARASTEWRLLMWRALMPDLPKYFWLGKGYALNPQDLYLSAQAARFGRAPDYVAAMAAGDYHNGPLSTYIPLGIFGLLAFIAFLVASLRALYLNYRYGPQELKVLNRFLFAYFLGYTIFFFTVFGGFSGELFRFTGTVAFSLALNRGICRKPSAWELARVPSRNAPAGALPSPA